MHRRAVKYCFDTVLRLVNICKYCFIANSRKQYFWLSINKTEFMNVFYYKTVAYVFPRVMVVKNSLKIYKKVIAIIIKFVIIFLHHIKNYFVVVFRKKTSLHITC